MITEADIAFDKYMEYLHDYVSCNIFEGWEYPDLLKSIHGPLHWKRVEENGLLLSKTTGANLHVVRLFALLHDARRINEEDDPDHGDRAARWIRHSSFLDGTISPYERGLLVDAIERHSSGEISKNVTIGTCWDADRLDLTRPGIAYKLDPHLFSTDCAKDIIRTFNRTI